MNNPLFYAKILLFGEYGIIEDSQGLTLPYSFYKGTLKFSDLDNDFEKKSNQSLEKYSNYLSELELPAEYNLDVKSFKFIDEYLDTYTPESKKNIISFNDFIVEEKKTKRKVGRYFYNR